MSGSSATVEDPLIAALPPNTDYITYLTILEYQLTPRNLPTLNRLLLEDDGTLASEIGWDLLKLVLPILRVEPANAKECLDIISRRGNPREVIVRVSEELETLGLEDSDDEADPTESTDDIPTFAGEAPHVHLGQMTLDGMPPPENLQPQDEEDEETIPDSAVEEIKLQSLLSMLSSLHPRIKTQYPSRFLATSLPAALGAYRRLSMNTDSTLSFLNTLLKLSGKVRPNLPPRLSTADVLKQSPTPSASTVASAPLPDPESKSESTAISQSISDNEDAINRRLLQAVLLEVLEEHTTASSEAQPPLTARLRTRTQPHSLTSARKMELDALVTSDPAATADSLRQRFITIAEDLKLDTQAEITRLLQPASSEVQTEEEHEYPTSPSQIPMAATGLLLMYSAQNFVRTRLQSPQNHSEQKLDMHVKTILQLINNQYATDARLRQSAPALDCILSILYTVFCTNSFPLASTDSAPILLTTFTLLKDIFITSPDPDLRDNAHHIATHLIHGHFSAPARLLLIKDLLATPSPSPFHETQTATLKALAVSWLKDEIYPTATTTSIMQTLQSPSDRGLPKSTLISLVDILFPTDSIPPPPHPAQPAIQTINTTKIPTPDPSTLPSTLPLHIPTLNLLTLFVKSHIQQPPNAPSPNDQPVPTTELTPLLDHITSYLAKLEAWSTYLSARLASATSEEDTEDVSVADVYALEDAVGRARAVIGVGSGGETITADVV